LCRQNENEHAIFDGSRAAAFFAPRRLLKNDFMKMRSWSWISLCLLLLAGAWLFWSPGSRRAVQKPAATAVRPTVTTSRAASTAPLLFGSGNNATNSAPKTNAFAYRLTNTKKSLGQLMADPHAILLENALLDTRTALNLSIPKNLQAQGDPGAYLVQANGPITSAFRAALAAAGAQIVSYIPNNAYLVTISAGGAAALAGRPGVQSVNPYEPYYKISASLLGLAVNQKDLPDNTALTLGLFPNTAAQTVNQIKQLGATVVATDQSPFGPIVRVSPPKNWTSLAVLPGVQIVEPAHRRALANDLARVTLQISIDTVTNANYLGLSGSNVLVEVNDTGIDAAHPDFSVTGSAGSPGSSPPSRVIGDINNPAFSTVDTVGHGTHVAGIIAGNGSKSYSVTNTPSGSVTNADFRGKAPAARLYSVEALDNTGNSDTSDYYLQTTPALTNALISNNSWTYVGDNSYDLAAASYDAAVRDALPTITGSQPVLFVFAAGNQGGGDDNGGSGNPDTITSPGTAKDVITVGALEQLRNITNSYTPRNETNQVQAWAAGTSSSYQVAGYSARGNVGIGTEGDFGRFKPDVVAPGSFVVSTRSEQWNQNAYYNPTNDNFTVLPDFVTAQSMSDPNSGSFTVYDNAAVVTIQLEPIVGGPPLPDNLPIYVWPGTDSTTATPVLAGTNFVSMPAVPNGTSWSCAVSNPNPSTVAYNLVVDVLTTNDMGDYLIVLSNLNNTIGPWYRYESGTSMAAPAVSGSLALIQDYFTNTLHTVPSPALLKAMLINGSRAVDGNSFTVTNNINFQGWGLANVPNSVAPGLTNKLNVACSTVVLDQSPTNSLATGDSQSYLVTVTNTAALALPLRVTLAWTDPPGNPAAAIKLVNNLILVVSNNITREVFFGNDFPPSSTFNSAWHTNESPNLDTINNIQNVFLPAADGSNYTVTVIGRSVNVNAVTAQTNNVVQDYALVFSSGSTADGVTNAFIVTTPNPPVSNPTGDQQITTVLVDANGMATNSSNGGGVFLNQLAGANTPLLGTNQVDAVSNYTSAAVVTLGMTNQWHFYVVQNTTGFSNAAFVTFLPETLSMPRMGVLVDPSQNPTQPESDIDLYVSTDPGLTNLNPNVISNCVNGTQIGMSVGNVFNGASLSSGGTEFVVDSNSKAGEPYYVGVKSETAIASEFGFLPVFSQQPFSQSGPNGETVNGLLLPMLIPDGTTAHPGVRYIFALAIQPIQVQDVIVSNQIVHENIGDLTGTLSHNNKGVVLNSHYPPNGTGIYNFIFNDSPSAGPGSQPSAGPGSLQQFQGQEGVGPWILTEADNSSGQTGAVTALTLQITPHQPLNQGVNVSIAAQGYFYGFIDVPVGTTNLTLSATNISGTTLDPNSTTKDYPPYGVLYEKLGEQPVPPPTPLTNFDQSVILDQIGSLGPGGSIFVTPFDIPPIEPGRYYVTLYNPAAIAQQYFIIASLGIGKVQPVDFNPAGSVPLLDDAVSYASINNPFTGGTNETIAAINVGIRVEHPRISDLVFTLISPNGSRYLLMENRGNTSTNGAGVTVITTNIVNIPSSGSEAPNTNFIPVGLNAGTLAISYNFYKVADQMTVYYGTNNFAVPVFNSGMISGAGQTNISFPAGIGYLTIIMNQYSNNAAAGQDLWTYTAGGVQTNFAYLTFTEDTNLTTTPIKFAPTPFIPNTASDLVWTDSFEAYAPGTYTTSFGGWTVLANSVEIVTNPPAADGINLLQLDNGVVSTTLPTVAGRQYVLSYQLGSRQTEPGVPLTNANWHPVSFSFTASQANTPLVLQTLGTTPAIPANAQIQTFGANALVDAFTLTEVPGNLYYQPEVDLTPLIGTSAYGLWQLEIQDDRVGATNNVVLDSWQLQFVFANTNPATATLIPGTEICNFVPANDILWYQVKVPLNATFATNTLFSADMPVNLLINTNSPDTNGAVTVLPSSTNGTNILSTTSGTPLLIPGSAYYLGVQNPNSIPVNTCIGLDFNLLTLAYAFTEPAQLVTGASAQLNGFATPNGYFSTAWFEWGTNTQYGNSTTKTNVGSGYGVVYVTNSIPTVVNVPYHFRLVVSNVLGVVYGFDQILDEANVVAWGADYDGQLNVPANLNNVVAIAAAYDHSLALKTNGQIVAWGDNTSGQAIVPASLSNAVTVAVAGGEDYSSALDQSGIVTAWGGSSLGLTNVPPGLSNVVVIAGGSFSSLALKSDGSVATWGIAFLNAPAGLSNLVAVAGGRFHSLALKNDGTVTAWGDNTDGQTSVPTNLNNVVAIAAGGYHNLALKNDGTVVAWGYNFDGQTDVPAGLNNVVAIAAGSYYSMALKADGTIVTWGDNSSGEASVPVGLTNVVAISAGNFHSLALTPQVLINLTNGVILPIVPGEAQTNNIFAGNINYYQVNVPTNADFATNTLLFANNGTLNIWFSTNTPPTLNATNATQLGFNVTNGVWVLNTNSVPTNIIPGSTYYLGVQNTNSFTVTYGIQVDFHLTTPPIPPPFTNIITISSIVHTTNGFLLTWFAPSNDLFQVQWSSGFPLLVWQTFTNPPFVSYNPNFPASATNAQFNFLDDGTQAPFGGPTRFYRLVQLGSLLNLSNNVPQTANVAPGGTAYYSFTVPANADAATNALVSSTAPVSLLFNQNGLPTGTNAGGYTLLANSTSGISVLTGATTPKLVPGATYYLGVQNTNTVTVQFTLQVNFHVPTGPIAYPISGILKTNIGSKPGYLLVWSAPTNDTFQVQHTDGLSPINWQNFSNIITYSGPPTPTNGIFSFFDDGSQTGGLPPVRFYQLLLQGGASSANTPPVLPAQPVQTLNPLATLTVTNTATDANIPAQTLTYTLSSTVAGANIPVITANGVITWTPANAQAGTTNTFTTVVTDNGVPPLSATNSFAVIVKPLPVISSVTVSNGNYLLTWLAPTNDIFTVQVATNLALPIAWQTVGTNITYTGPVTPTNGWFSFIDNLTVVPSSPIRFYRLILTGVVPPAAAASPFTISSITATNGSFVLTWSAPVNDQFQVRWATNLILPINWTTFPGTNTSTTGNFSFTDTNAALTMKFYELILLP
jgi:alpha-tubulin suppressor-like RCC1 family protein/subtilisin-like proprotein convertase family protein